MSGPWDRPSRDPGAEWPSEDLESPRSSEPRETEGDAWASGDLWPESPRDAESAWGDWPSAAPSSDDDVVDEPQPTLSDPWAESWTDESADPLAAAADAWAPPEVEAPDEPTEPIQPPWEEPAAPEPADSEPVASPTWGEPEPDPSVGEAPAVEAEDPFFEGEASAVDRPEVPPAPVVQPWAVDTDPWGAAVSAEDVQAEAAPIESEPETAAEIEPTPEPEPEPESGSVAAAIETDAAEPESTGPVEVDAPAEPELSVEPDAGPPSWRRFVPWAASAGAAADADAVPELEAEPEPELSAELAERPADAQTVEEVAEPEEVSAEGDEPSGTEAEQTESAWRRFAPWASAAAVAATTPTLEGEPEAEPEPEPFTAEIESEPETAASEVEPEPEPETEPVASEAEPEPDPEPEPVVGEAEPEPEPVVAETEPEANVTEAESAAAEVEPEPTEPEPEPAAAEVEADAEVAVAGEPEEPAAEGEPVPLAPWAAAASPWTAPEGGEEPAAAARMPDWLITDEEPATPVEAAAIGAATTVEPTDGPPESTQVLPTSWTPPPPPAAEPAQASGGLEPVGGDARTRLGTPEPDLDEDLEPQASTAEQAVPWLIGFILLLAGMVIVLLALIFAGDQSLGAGLLGASASATPSSSEVPSPSPAVVPSQTPQPSPSQAPSATPVPVPEYGPLEMIYQGRAAALAPIYLLRHDFTTEDEPVTLAQDASLDVRRFAWAPDGTMGAGLLADVLVSIEEGQEKRRLGEGIATLTFGEDAATIYAVRVTEDGANDVATVLAVDFASGDTSELATINYPRPDLGDQNALAEAQFEDEGGAVRLYWMENGMLRLWARGGGTWEIAPDSGEVTDLEEALPVLWAADLTRRITIEAEDGGTTLTLLDDGDPVASTSFEGVVSHLRWSPNGDRVAFTLGRSASGGGIVQNLWLWDLGDDEQPSQLTATGAAFGVEWRGASPKWRD